MLEGDERIWDVLEGAGRSLEKIRGSKGFWEAVEGAGKRWKVLGSDVRC